MREIKIKIGPNLSADEIREALNDFDSGNDECSQLSDVAYALLAARMDWRVNVSQVIVEDVFIDPKYPSQVSIQFTSSWSLYAGCDDQNGADDEDEDETATYTQDGFLIFLVPEERKEIDPC